MYRIVCDGCGETVKEGGVVYPVGIGTVKRGLAVNGNVIQHLCPFCFCRTMAILSREIRKGTKAYFAKEDADETGETDPEDVGPDVAEPDDRETEAPAADDPEPVEDDDIEEMAKSGDGRRKTDIGKIMALHNAGWNNGEIADEMGMDKRAVYNVIYFQRRKGGNRL